MRYAGAGVLWNDAGWYDEWGSWNGPPYAEVIQYLNKHGMKMMNWLCPSSGYPGSRADRELGPIMTSPFGGLFWLDEAKPEVVDWELNMLSEKVAAWGDHQWRYDMTPGHGSDPLLADKGFRRLNREFVTKNPGSAVDACMGGGTWIGVELASYASSGEVTDGGVRDYTCYHASLFIPPDLLHNIVYRLDRNRRNYSLHNDRIQLRGNPVWLDDPAGKGGRKDYRAGSTLGIRAKSLPGTEALRKDWDIYKYLMHQRVVGRWSHVFRPRVTGDEAVLYFQRMNREGDKGVILTT